MRRKVVLLPSVSSLVYYSTFFFQRDSGWSDQRLAAGIAIGFTAFVLLVALVMQQILYEEQVVKR